MLALDVPGLVTALVAIVALAGGGLAAWIRLAGRVGRLESQVEDDRDTIRRLTDVVWAVYADNHHGRRPPDRLAGR